MTKEQIKELDRLFQERVLELNKNSSMLGGTAGVVHHFIPKSQGFSLRWYIPNGVPLQHEQHQAIHGKNKAKLEGQIIRLRGEHWRSDLRIQSRKIAKNISYQTVLNHLNGSENYV
jgi:hypothetical protein